MELFILPLFYLVATTLTLAAFEASTETEHEVVTFIRAKRITELIKTSSCSDLTADQNCTLIQERAPSLMHFYMAEKVRKESTLTMLVPTRPSSYEMFDKLDAVVVVDPMPDAHFGHAIVVALVKFDYTKKECDKLNGIHYTTPG